MTTQLVDPVAFVSPASSLETLTTVTVRAPDPGPAEANPLFSSRHGSSAGGSCSTRKEASVPD